MAESPAYYRRPVRQYARTRRLFASRFGAIWVTRATSWSPRLPTLICFLIVLGGLAGLVYGGLDDVATFVKISPHEITETVDLPKAPK